MEKDTDLQRILLDREIPEPSGRLDEIIMIEIGEITKRKKENQKSLRFAWIFFAIGLLSGVLLTTLLIDYEGYKAEAILSSKIFLQIFTVIILLVLFDRLYDATVNEKNA